MSKTKQPTGRKRKQETKNKKQAINWAEPVSVAGILLLTFIAFFPSLKAGFVNWDDNFYLLENAIAHDLSWTNIKHVFDTGTYVMANYHPLTILSYAVEFSFIKLDPFYYHLDNVLLHLLNVLLVYFFTKLLMKAIFGSRTIANSNSGFSISTSIALITTILFAIHPMRVESVTWAAERKDVLYTFFFLASALCYIGYIKRLKIAEEKVFTFSWRYVAALFLFLCSILSKGQAAMLPPVLLLIDYFFLHIRFSNKSELEKANSTSRRYSKSFLIGRLVDKIPFLLIAVYYGLISISAQQTSAFKPEYHTLLERFAIANYGLVMYLFKFFVPLNLSCFYRYPEQIEGFYYAAPFIVVTLIVGIWLIVKRMRDSFADIILLGSLFFIVTISLLLQFFPIGTAVIAERYTYIPYIGLFWIVSAAFVKLKNVLPKYKTVLTAIGSIYLIWFFFLTHAQTKVWKDSVSLWTGALESNPETAQGYNNRGIIYMDNANYDLAYSDFWNAIKYKPDFHMAVVNYATVLGKIGKTDSAFFYFKRAIKGDPNLYEAFNNRGNLYFSLHKYDEAIADYNRCIEINPFLSKAFFNRSGSYYNKQEYKLALADALKAQSLGYAVDPKYFEVLNAMVKH